MSRLERKGLRKTDERTANMQVTILPMGSQIKMRVTGKVVCTRYPAGELSNSLTCSASDLVWLNVFGSRQEVQKFLKKNRAVKKVIPVVAVYSSCDRVLNS